MKRASPLLQQMVSIVLSRVECKSVLVYLDSLVVYSKPVTEQRVHVSIALTLP